MSKIKLAIVATHPVQYSAPVFRELNNSARVQPRVFYTWSQTAAGEFYDHEFGTQVSWDVPLLEGYDYCFVVNTAADPGPHHFRGIRNPGLCREIAAWGANAILVYGWNNISHLDAMRYFKGRMPVFFRGDSTLLDARPPVVRWMRWLLLNWVYRHVDIAISVGRNSRDYFAWCGIPKSRIAFAPHSIDNQRFADRQGLHQKTSNEWRTQFGISQHDIVILFAAKLIAKKDPLLLLRAFERTNQRAQLVFCGSGELEPGLREAARDNQRIHFMPFQNQSLMPAVYRIGDVFVLPSCGPGETWGLALNEAMACRRPVIASSMVGASRDLVQRGYNGWAFTAGDVDELTGTLNEAIGCGTNRLRAMGVNAESFIHDWSTTDSAAEITNIVEQHCQSPALTHAAQHDIQA
jgi:glycosyltransferase involved in cell wall biosynthesis